MRRKGFHSFHLLVLISFLFAVSIYSASQAFPPTYVPAPARAAAYNTLLAAKKAWLQGKIAHERGLINAARPGLTSNDERVRAQAEDQIDKYTKDLKDDRADLAKLGGARVPAQEAVVKKNVKAWIDALTTEIHYYEGLAETAAKKAEEANSKIEAGWRRKEEKDYKKVAADDKKEKDDLEKDATDAGLLP
jgi:hypothetical protein